MPSAKNADIDLNNLPQWDLGDLYPGMDSAEFAKDLGLVQIETAEFETEYSGKLEKLAEKSSDSLGEAIARLETIEERIGRIMSYAMLIYTGDTADPAKAKFYGDAREKITAAGSHLVFFALELNKIDARTMAAAFSKSKKLAHYRPWVEDLAKDKPHQLDENSEQIFLEKSVTARAAWVRLFDETMAALRFDIDGEALTIEPALNLLQSPERQTRQKAGEEIGLVLEANSRIFTLVTNTIAKDKEVSDRWRKFGDVAHSMHLANRVEPEVVDALVKTVEEAYPRLSHRYYTLKAKWLSQEKLSHFDRNAPVQAAQDRKYKDRKYNWGEAKDIVLSAYAGFAPEMADIASKFFDQSWIDAGVRPGKSPGAFAHPTVPSVHPYVMLNYLGTPRDVMTLAHELGHGVHQVLAGEQGALMARTPLTLAETASVFGEMLTFRSLLDQAKNATEKRALLMRKVEDMINTVVRQIAFYSFERKVHLARREGELTYDQLCDFWIEVQSASLGPIFEFDDHYRSYWSYVPHFVHSPFYVYAYAFGDCLVNSLYAVYQNADTDFQKRYFDLLKAGGTKHHSELLEPFGLSAAEPDFWQKGVGMIEALIDELEKQDIAAA